MTAKKRPSVSAKKTREIRIIPPSKDEPGYLRRQKEFFDLYSRYREFDPTAVDDMVNWILTRSGNDPEDEELQEALFDMTEDEFLTILRATGGVEDEDGNTNSVPPTKKR